MEEPHRQPPFPALQDAIDQVFSERIGDVSGGGRLASDMREIWMMQPRFEKRVGNSAFSLVDQSRFPRGLTNEKFYLAAVSPQAFPMTGMSSGWPRRPTPNS